MSPFLLLHVVRKPLTRSECDSLADGKERRQREEGKECDCKEGWGGINCNGMLAGDFHHHLSIMNLCSLHNGSFLRQFSHPWHNRRRPGNEYDMLQGRRNYFREPPNMQCYKCVPCFMFAARPSSLRCRPQDPRPTRWTET